MSRYKRPTGVWRDSSSYSRDDPHPREPNSFELETDSGVRVSVHRLFSDTRNWYASVYWATGMPIRDELLGEISVDEAKARTLSRAIEIFCTATAELTAAVPVNDS